MLCRGFNTQVQCHSVLSFAKGGRGIYQLWPSLDQYTFVYYQNDIMIMIMIVIIALWSVVAERSHRTQVLVLSECGFESRLGRSPLVSLICSQAV